MASTIEDLSTIEWQGGGAWVGGTVTALALSPHFATDALVLAGTQAGLFLSCDGGLTWQQTNRGLDDPQITALTIFADEFTVMAVAATQSGHLYQARWEAHPTQLLLNWQLLTSWTGLGVAQALTPSPHYGQDHTLFIATDAGIFRSQNGGETWESSTFGLLDLDILCLACAPDFAESEVLWAGSSGGGLYRSRNGARSWRDSGVGLPDAALLSLLVLAGAEQTATLFVGTEDHGIYCSTDGSATWEAFAPALATASINDMACTADGMHWIVATAAGLYYSGDGGDTWQPARTNDGTDVPVALAVVLTEQCALAGTAYDGMVRSLDHGATWAAQNQGLVAHAAPYTQMTPDRMLVGLDVDGLLARYVNRAGTDAWILLNDALDGSAVMACTATAVAETPLIVAGESQLFLAETTGGSEKIAWRTCSMPPESDPITVVCVTPSFADDQTLFLGDGAGQLWCSANQGLSWQQLTVPWSGAALLQLACSPFYLQNQHLYAVTALPADNGVAIQLTIWQGKQGGATWEALADLQSDSATVALHLPQDPVAQPIFVALRNRLIKLSQQHSPMTTDGTARQWQVEQKFLPEQLRITSIVTTPTYIEDHLILVTTTTGVYGQVEALAHSKLGSELAEWQLVWPEIAQEPIVGLHCTNDGQPYYLIGLGGKVWQRSYGKEK